MCINEGDRVIPHKPSDINKYPTWNSKYMDVFDNKEFVVSSVDEDLVVIKHPYNKTKYYFRPEWLELVDILDDADINQDMFLSGVV